MLEQLLPLIIIVGAVGIVLLTVYLVVALLKRHALQRLYADNARDFRFVCELLRLFADKKSLIKNPCLLRSYGNVPPRADALIVGGGGVLILTVVDAPGQYSTPTSGHWTVWQGGEAIKMNNAFLPGRQYTSVLSGIMVKCGLSCPIVNVVVLTDDHATVDSLHSEFVLTCKDLIAYVKGFCNSRALGSKGQEKLKNAIRQHHELCQRQLSSAMVGEPQSAFTPAPAEVFRPREDMADPEGLEQALEEANSERAHAEEIAEEKEVPSEELIMNFSVHGTNEEETVDEAGLIARIEEGLARAREAEEKTTPTESDLPKSESDEEESEENVWATLLGSFKRPGNLDKDGSEDGDEDMKIR